MKVETELLADKLAKEDSLPEHRDDRLHMIVKDTETLGDYLPVIKRWLKFFNNPANDACKAALRRTSDANPSWTAAEIVHFVRKKNAPNDKDEHGFKLSQNLEPCIARWLAYDDPQRRARFTFHLMGKKRVPRCAQHRCALICPRCAAAPAIKLPAGEVSQKPAYRRAG